MKTKPAAKLGSWQSDLETPPATEVGWCAFQCYGWPSRSIVVLAKSWYEAREMGERALGLPRGQVDAHRVPIDGAMRT